MPIAIGVLVVLSLPLSIATFPARFCDFRAFYCSGRAVLAGQDPYREHPLHECEHALPGPFVSDLPLQITIPAPYPGYALQLFSIVARLPFNDAVISWTVGSCMALGLALVFVSRLTATRLSGTAIALGFPAAVIPLPLGQPTLFVLAGLSCTAMLLRAGCARRAALAASVTLLDPQVGLAVCAGLFVAVPRTRLTLLAGMTALEAISLISFGPAREVEYFREVLPLHALVNVPEFSQFSAANLAYTAGLAPELASLLGHIWYAVAVVVGVIAGLRLQPRFGAPAVAFVPLAFAVFGGSHAHLQQLELALPAFLLVTSAAASGMRRNMLVVITFTASVPWLISAAQPAQLLLIPVLGVAFARVMGSARVSSGLGLGSCVVLLVLCVAIVISHGPDIPFEAVKNGNPLAEVSWGRFVNATSVPPRAWYVLGKLPTLLAFAGGLAFMLQAAQAPPARSSRIATEAGCRIS